MFTAVVVLPTPPFWLATTITRVWSGRGSGVPRRDPGGPGAAAPPPAPSAWSRRSRTVSPTRSAAVRTRACASPVASMLLTPSAGHHANLNRVSRETGGPVDNPPCPVDPSTLKRPPRPVDNSIRLWTYAPPAMSCAQRTTSGAPAALPSAVRCAAGHRALTLHHRHRWGQPLRADRLAPAGRRHRAGGAPARGRPPHRSADAPFIARNRPPGRTQRHRPTREPVHRSHRSRRHHIEHCLTVELFGPPPMDGHVGQSHCGRRQVQKRGTTQQWLHQSHRRSGRRIARAMPGRPAPLPMSHTVLPRASGR